MTEQERAKQLFTDHKIVEVDMILRTWNIHNGSKLQTSKGVEMIIDNIKEGLGTCDITAGSKTAQYTLGQICKAIIIGNIQVEVEK